MPSDEKLPFAQKSKTFSDNGAIAKEWPLKTADDNGGIPNKFQTEEEEKPSEMSTLRKLCFFLSLNVGILYIATFAWILPCRGPDCMSNNSGWTLNFSDVWLTTSLDTSTSTSPQLLFFGFVNNRTGNLAGVEVTDGKEVWTRETDFIPRHIFCHFKTVFDANEDNVPDCLVISHNAIEVFNVSNGEPLWQHDMHHSRLDIITSIHPATQGNGNSFIGMFGKSLFVIEGSGKDVFETPTPCSDALETELSPVFVHSNDTLWYLKCDFGDEMEVWTFLEQELLNFARTGGHADGFMGFSQLLGGDHYNRSMVLSSDVTATSDSLALSWANAVVMVTSQAPFHSIPKTWERYLVDPLGLPLSITSITNGHFTNSKEDEIAAAAQVDSIANLYILKKVNGSIVNSFSLGKRKIIKIERMPGAQNLDSLLVESIPEEPSDHFTVNISDPEPMNLQRSYLLVDLSKTKTSVTNVFESNSVLETTIYAGENGSKGLLLATETTDGFSLIRKQILERTMTDESKCDNVQQFEL
ncbi:uncharacterized protein LOC129227630 isoform X2 [Uloborus diversus]|nr:uncharacterized protein LOC129227630 isoform X2 [Uloborus diversus]